MILGAWFHDADGKMNPEQLQAASAVGLTSIRNGRTPKFDLRHAMELLK